MTDYQCRTLLDKLHGLCRFVQESAEHEQEALLLTAILSTALLGALEFVEANHSAILHEGDWPSVLHFFTIKKKDD